MVDLNQVRLEERPEEQIPEREEYSIKETEEEEVKSQPDFYDSYEPNLGPLQEDRLKAELHLDITGAITDQAPDIAKFKALRDQHNAKPLPKPSSMSWATDFMAPLTKIKNDEATLRISGPFTGYDLQAEDEAEQDAINRKEKYLNWQIQNTMDVLYERTLAVEGAVQIGTGLLEVEQKWKYESREVTETYGGMVEITETDPLTGEQYNIEVPDPTEIARFLKKHKDVADKYPEEYNKIKNGEKVTLTIQYKDPVYSGPHAEAFDREDFVKPKDYTKVEEMPFAFRKKSVSWDDLKKLEDDAGIDPLKIEEMTYIKDKDGNAKKDADYTKRKYDIYVGFYTFDIDNDENRTKIQVIYALKENVLLKACSDYFLGRKRFLAYRIHPKRNSFDGESMSEKMAQIDFMSNSIIQHILNSYFWADNPMLWVDDPTGQRDWDREMTFPGKIFNVSGGGKMGQVQLKSNAAADGIPLLQLLFRIGDDVTGITEYMHGRESTADPEAPGKKVDRLLSQASLRMANYIKSIKRSDKELAYLILELNIQWGTKGSKYGEKGEDGYSFQNAPSPEELRETRTKFEPKGDEMTLYRDHMFKQNVAALDIYNNSTLAKQYPEGERFLLEKIYENMHPEIALSIDKFLPTPEKIKQGQIDNFKEALKQREEDKAFMAQRVQRYQSEGKTPEQAQEMAQRDLKKEVNERRRVQKQQQKEASVQRQPVRSR